MANIKSYVYLMFLRLASLPSNRRHLYLSEARDSLLSNYKYNDVIDELFEIPDVRQSFHFDKLLGDFVA